MDFWDQVWKRVWEMAFFGLKLGLDLEMRAAHPHQKFQGVPPPGSLVYSPKTPHDAKEFTAEWKDKVLKSLFIKTF